MMVGAFLGPCPAAPVRPAQQHNPWSSGQLSEGWQGLERGRNGGIIIGWVPRRRKVVRTNYMTCTPVRGSRPCPGRSPRYMDVPAVTECGARAPAAAQPSSRAPPHGHPRGTSTRGRLYTVPVYRYCSYNVILTVHLARTWCPDVFSLLRSPVGT